MGFRRRTRRRAIIAGAAVAHHENKKYEEQQAQSDDGEQGVRKIQGQEDQPKRIRASRSTRHLLPIRRTKSSILRSCMPLAR